MVQVSDRRQEHTVALFDASDDTVEMVQQMLSAAGLCCLVGCPFADLKRGRTDFARYIAKHNPDVVVFDISPPYEENWAFLQTLCGTEAMVGRGLVVTTTNKQRLDEILGVDLWIKRDDATAALEIVGKPYDLDQIRRAIAASLPDHRVAPS